MGGGALAEATSPRKPPGSQPSPWTTLLDDISKEVSLADHWRHAPKGLTKLLNRAHEHGTELSWAELEQARSQQTSEDLY